MNQIPQIFIDQYQSALHVICTSPKVNGQDTLKYINFQSQVQEATDSYIAIQVREILDSSVPTGLIYCDDVKDKKQDSLPIKEGAFPSLETIKPTAGRTAMINLSFATLEKLVKYMKKAKIDYVDIFEHGKHSAYTVEFRDIPHVTGIIMKCRTDKFLNPIEIMKDDIKSEDLPF